MTSGEDASRFCWELGVKETGNGGLLPDKGTEECHMHDEATITELRDEET